MAKPLLHFICCFCTAIFLLHLLHSRLQQNFNPKSFPHPIEKLKKKKVYIDMYFNDDSCKAADSGKLIEHGSVYIKCLYRGDEKMLSIHVIRKEV